MLIVSSQENKLQFYDLIQMLVSIAVDNHIEIYKSIKVCTPNVYLKLTEFHVPPYSI